MPNHGALTTPPAGEEVRDRTRLHVRDRTRFHRHNAVDNWHSTPTPPIPLEGEAIQDIMNLCRTRSIWA